MLKQIFCNLFTTTGEIYLNFGKEKNSPVALVSKYSAGDLKTLTKQLRHFYLLS